MQVHYFLVMILDNNNQIERAFSCGIYNSHPFCIEGTPDGNKYATNSDYLFRVYGEYDDGTDTGCDNGSIVHCYGSVYAETYYYGGVNAGVDNGGYCRVLSSGALDCNEDGWWAQ